MQKYKHNHDCPFEAFITNLGKYNEGEMVGEWVTFPTTADHIKEVFRRIGINCYYEEWFISDYNINIEEIDPLVLGEYANLDDLNALAIEINKMNEQETKKYIAILKDGNYSCTLQDLISAAKNLNSFYVDFDIRNYEDLGRNYMKHIKICNSSNNCEILFYIDYEKLGKDLSLKEGGTITEKGYVVERHNINDIRESRS